MKGLLHIGVMLAAALVDAWAAGESFYKIEAQESEHLHIFFSEPVVPASATYPMNGDLTAVVQVSAGPKPQVHWEDQDTIEVRFAKGTVPGTSYRLELPETQRHYLSGKALPGHVVEFTAPPCRVVALEPPGLSWGIPGGAVVLLAEQECYSSEEVVAFAAEAEYSFVVHAESRPQRVVAGRARAARVGELPEKLVADFMGGAPASAWAALEPESSVPGLVVVEPVEDLRGCKWSLRVQHPKGLIQVRKWRDEYEPQGYFEQELRCVPELTPVVQEGRERLYLELCFSAPVAAVEAEGIFRSLGIASGEHVAEPVADGYCKVLKLDGQEIRFTYDPLPAHSRYFCRGDGGPYILESPARLASRIGVWVDGAQKLPVPLLFTLPAGTRAAAGLCMSREQHIPFALNPLRPTLPTQKFEGHGEAMLMPLHGAHVLKMRCAGSASLVVRAARLEAEQYLRLHGSLRNLLFRSGFGYEELSEKLAPLFGAEKVFSVSPPTLGWQEVELPLDEVPGFGKPGFYVLAVKAFSPVGQQILTAPGKTPSVPEQERYYLLHVTDLKAYSLRDSVSVVRLSDGLLVQQGEVRLYKDVEAGHFTPLGTFSPGEAVAVQKEYSSPDLVLVQSGEDFTLAEPRTFMPPPASKSGGCVSVFTDRRLYRPGDTLHICAVVRARDAEGTMVLPPPGQEVRVTVGKNRKLCHESSLKLDSYGTAYLDWQLPADAEAAVGCYQVEVLCADGSQGGVSVECEVFRRDAFAVQCEAEVDLVRPGQATLRVQAQGFDGLPVADGVAHLEVKVGRDKYELKLPLDAAGSAVHEMQLGNREEWTKGSPCELWISGSVYNGRQEYVRLPGVWKTLYPADFCIEWGVDSGEMVPTLKLTPAGEDEAQPLERAQDLELSLWAPVYVPQPYSNGLVIHSENMQCVWQQRITVPTGCKEGVKPQLAPVLRKLVEDRYRMGNRSRFLPLLRVQGVDARGNNVEVARQIYCERRLLAEQPAAVYSRVEARMQGRELVVPASFGSSGRAVLLLRSRQGRQQDTVEVQAWKQELRLPLPPGTYGVVQGSLLLPVLKNGCYSKTEVVQFSTVVPEQENRLRVEWQVPQGAQAPGSRVQVRGRVFADSGEPATHAALCLWAVDAGMLSVSSFTLPAPWEEFLYESYMSYGLEYAPKEFSFTLPQLYDVELRMASFCERLSRNWNDESNWISVSCHFVENQGYYKMARSAFRSEALEELDDLWDEPELGTGLGFGVVLSAGGGVAQPRLRQDFTPTPLWLPAMRTDAEGRFAAEFVLPDTLTTYRVMALVQGEDGKSFGNGEAELVVNQPVMLTPGTPLFMSVGDSLRLPVSIANNTASPGTWTISMQGAAEPQQLTLPAGETATLYFDVSAAAEGECTLQWQAVSDSGSDAVQGSFPVRFPAPVLQEVHHLALRGGDAPLQVQELLSPELRSGRALRVEVELCADSLQQLQGYLDFALAYPYGCTEQRASNLLPWLLYERLAPYCGSLRRKDATQVAAVVQDTVALLLRRQRQDGGLSYWNSGESCYWASAQAALVLTFAEEAGYDVPAEPLAQLRDYLRREFARQENLDAYTRYAVGRACEDFSIMDAALAEAAAEQGELPSRFFGRKAAASLRLLADLRGGKANYYPAFNRWLRSVVGGVTHLSTWDSGWVFIALHEFLRTAPEATVSPASLTTAAGKQIIVGSEPLRLSFEEAATLTPTAGTAYITVKARALPEKTDYPGVTEKGLQITRIYEKRGADGVWREAREFNVGDVVRVTLTCAKTDRELEYFVLEDYLPACMEAINPNVPSQAAGLEWSPWSHWFDHKEYLAYRVRGFCTRWGGRDLLNMSYYARVKRAGTSTAPPAQGQLMYEPQTYGLSPNAVIISK